MTPDRHEAVVVVGHAAPTSHDTAAADIGALWAKVQATGMLEGTDAWMIYDQYEGGPYRAVLGKRIAPSEPTPEGLVRLEVPAQEGVSIRCPAEPSALVKTWETVWGHWPDGGPRAFTADVEHWSSEGIHIFIGLGD